MGKFLSDSYHKNKRYCGFGPVKGKGVSPIALPSTSEPILANEGVDDAITSSCARKPSTNDSMRGLINIIEDHGSACDGDTNQRYLFVVFMDVADDLFIEFFKIDSQC